MTSVREQLVRELVGGIRAGINDANSVVTIERLERVLLE
jgi:hypothetical protein